MSDHDPKRRWYNVSLRELLIFIALIATTVWGTIATLDARQAKTDAKRLKEKCNALEERQDKYVDIINQLKAGNVNP